MRRPTSVLSQGARAGWLSRCSMHRSAYPRTTTQAFPRDNILPDATPHDVRDARRYLHPLRTQHNPEPWKAKSWRTERSVRDGPVWQRQRRKQRAMLHAALIGAVHWRRLAQLAFVRRWPKKVFQAHTAAKCLRCALLGPTSDHTTDVSGKRSPFNRQ